MSVLILCFIVQINVLKGQNLVPNPSFEEYDQLPTGDGKMTGFVKDWENACTSIGGYPNATPDYLHTKGKNFGKLGEEYFAVIDAHTGKAIVGLSTYNSYAESENFREYICVPLSAPLIAGKNYRCSFWLTNGKKPIRCDKVSNGIGIALTNERLIQKTSELLITKPAWILLEGFKNTNWVELKFDYKAKGGERWLTVGNFLDDANTIRYKVYPNNGDCSYYFFDDFDVHQSDELLKDTVNKAVKSGEGNIPKVKVKDSYQKLNRQINNTNDVIVDKDSFLLEVWDHREEDGDSISLFINGKWILQHKELTNKKQTVWVHVEPDGDNVLVLYAHNLGRVPPNTAALRPLIGEKREYILSSNLKKSQSIRFVRSPKLIEKDRKANE